MTEVQAQLMLYYKLAPRAYSGFDASEGDETNFSHNCDGNARTHDKLKQQQQLSNNQAVSIGPGICLAVKFKANFQHTNIQNLRLASDHKTIIQEICSSTHKSLDTGPHECHSQCVLLLLHFRLQGSYGCGIMLMK